MATPEDVRRLALALPEVVDCSGKGLSFEVAGKGFAWSWNERIEPKKPRVPRLDVLAVRVDPEAKQAILDSDPDLFETDPHYDGFPAVLVRLSRADEATLKSFLVGAWAQRAPKKLLRANDLKALAGR